ncbi:CU044_5270 family protein [Actinomadura rubrisoli]|uniref:CU044_5270 family protein n=1 Tax=Actinomadura rubrisoli TaxID=2530368 RepID=A0A4R5A704_9ACTN|nr:CU044_5270 family protein [Actinomadura rubrisoli]TDD66559.1 hypothetical protein E1298_40260 [Actinomadura rubrisoli]
MDELQLLATVLDEPDQSPETIEQGRRRLGAAIHGPARRARSHKTAWMAGGLGLTAAAAATVVVVVSGHTGPTATPNGPPASGAAPAPTVRMSAKQVLLAASSSALAAQEGSGTYWHVKTAYTKGSTSDRSDPSIIETWARRDGKSWVRLGSSSGPVKNNDPDGPFGHYTDGFDVGDGKRLTLAQIQGLPTAPGALKARILSYNSRLPKNDALQGGLVGLLAGSPAPPKVRSAAFRALATLPGVKSLGPVNGGQGLLLPGPGKNMLAVNMRTSKVTGMYEEVIKGKKVYGSAGTLIAEWTNQLPPVTTPKKEQPPAKKPG